MESNLGGNKDQTEVEMTNMLDQESRELSSQGWSLDGAIEDIEWRGQNIKIYPLDYQKVGVVKSQIVCCLVMFSVFGLSDQTVGSLIPTLTEKYNISKVTVSLIFLIQVCGYTLASLCNERLHRLSGTRGAMLTACVLCIISYTVLVSKPSSFTLFSFCYFPLGLSIGILDSTGNVLMGNLLIHKNEWMGIMHGLYGASAMITPPITSYFVKVNKWSSFYALPLSLSLLGMVIIPFAFKYETAAKYSYICAIHQKVDSLEEEDTDQPPTFKELIRTPSVVLYATFLFLYLGAELSTGSWLFSYLLATKSDDRIKMSWVTSSYWTGLTVGRMGLGFVTKRIFANEYRASHTYAMITLFFYSIFVITGLHNGAEVWYLVCLFLTVFLCGVFIGPLFPNASIVAMQVLPKKLHISGVGVAVAIGGCGNAMLPYLVGVAMHYVGMSWLPVLCWFMVLSFTIVWRLYPRYLTGCEEYL